MKIRTNMHWRAPYGEASWIGVPVTHSGVKVGEVVEEEPCCKEHCVLTIQFYENERSLFCADKFDDGLFGIGVKEELTLSAIKAEPTTPNG